MTDALNGLTAEEVVTLLQLQPHPEGGHFRETFRDAPSGRDAAGRDVAGEARGASTAIYFLLKAGQRSHWHRVDATEIWHWHAGAPLTLAITDGDGRREVALGPDLKAGERPQAVVPPFAWQAAESRGAWTLVGCTVAPAFLFEGFELAPPGWEPD
ncbi:cupin domain-containing protein [Xanthobacter autotrophicus]|uniref:cupin domain-containing protein n=1 Tax=Xanthobacter autotrophicus TaxID=280 RepID=UPI00372C2EBB